jgi:hypothetical protein
VDRNKVELAGLTNEDERLVCSSFSPVDNYNDLLLLSSGSAITLLLEVEKCGEGNGLFRKNGSLRPSRDVRPTRYWRDTNFLFCAALVYK